jgi:small neutral amino acid transporter SnatA (MarC family)
MLCRLIYSGQIRAMWHEFLYAVGISVAAMFPIVNPIGHAPIFFAMTANDSLEFRRTQALKTSLWLIIILASSLLLGRWILEFFGITLDDLRIAGGLLVAHAAWGMLNNQSRMTLDEHTAAADKTDIAADGHANSGRPGLDESRPRHVDLWKHIDERRLSVWFRTDRPDDMVSFLSAERLVRLLGVNGAGALNRILGLLILAIAVNLIISGVRNAFPT